MRAPLPCILLLVALLSSCTHWKASWKERDAASFPSMDEAVAPYAFAPSLCPPPMETLLSEHETYTVHRIHFPDRADSLFPGAGVEAVEYRPRKTEGRAGAGILLLPIQGADYEVSTYFAEYFTSRGFFCLRFQRRAEWLVPERDLPSLALLIREYVIDIQRGLGWWRKTGRVAPERIGLFGVSMGAIIGSTVTALEGARLRASVLVLGGGPLAEILMTADDKDIGAVREQWMEKTGMDGNTLCRKLHGILDPVDPIRSAPLIRAPSTLMIQGKFDPVVRYPLGTALWEAAGHPERIVIPTGHYSSVLMIHYIRWKALKWFDQWLAPGVGG